MKMLNKNGVKKLNDYIDSTYGKIFEVWNDRLFGPESNLIFENLKKHGIVFEKIIEPEGSSQSSGSNINYKIMVEDTPTSTVPEPVAAKASQIDIVDATGNKEDVEKIKNLAKQLMPHFANQFATKTEINDALNILRSQLIDPEKLMELFKNMSDNIKKTQVQK